MIAEGAVAAPSARRPVVARQRVEHEGKASKARAALRSGCRDSRLNDRRSPLDPAVYGTGAVIPSTATRVLRVASCVRTSTFDVLLGALAQHVLQRVIAFV